MAEIVGKFKTGKARFYVAFITPEAKEFLLAYLKERERSGEQITLESPLITDSYNKGTFLSVESYEKVWGRMLRRAGLDDKSVSWFIYHIHTLRKYFRSNCVGVDPSYRERWMGHKGGYLDESYFKAEEQKHLVEYRKAIPHLSIHAAFIQEQQRRKQTRLDFARLQGWGDEQLRRLEDTLARKTVDEAITEFKRLKDPEFEPTQENPYEAQVIEEKDLIPRRGMIEEATKTLDRALKIADGICGKLSKAIAQAALVGAFVLVGRMTDATNITNEIAVKILDIAGQNGGGDENSE